MSLSLNRLSASVRIWTDEFDELAGQVCDRLNRLSASVRIWTVQEVSGKAVPAMGKS